MRTAVNYSRWFAPESLVSEQNPIRLFVTHAWEEPEDYLRVFEFLESSGRFYYRNLAQTAAPASADKESRRESLRGQIGPAEIVIAVASLGRQHADWLLFQMTFAQAAKRPVILLPTFGGSAPIPKAFFELASEVVAWDERALLDAVRRLARGEATGRWDVVEFKLD